MGLISTDLYVFHGTQTAYDHILLPGDPGFNSSVGQASGAAFYTFATTDPKEIETVRDNARVYATNGMVLNGTLKAGSFRALEGSAPIGSELTQAFHDVLQHADTGNADINRYYHALAEKLSPNMRGDELWGKIQGSAGYKAWVESSKVESLGDHIDATLRADRKALNGMLREKGWEDGIGGYDQFTDTQRTELADSLRQLRTDHPEYHEYYSHLAEQMEAGKLDPRSLFNKMSDENSVTYDTRMAAKNSIEISDDSVFEHQWQTTIKKLDIAGIYYRNSGAGVMLFQGDHGLRQMPELHVDELHGAPPKDVRNTPRPIQVGDVIVPQGGGRKTIPSSLVPEHTSGMQPQPQQQQQLQHQPSAQQIAAQRAQQQEHHAGAPAPANNAPAPNTPANPQGHANAAPVPSTPAPPPAPNPAPQQNPPVENPTPHTNDALHETPHTSTPGFHQRMARLGGAVSAATVVADTAQAAIDYKNHDYNAMRQHLTAAGQNAAMPVAQKLVEKGLVAGARTLGREIPLLGAVVGLGFGAWDVGSATWEAAHGRMDWTKVATTAASAAAGTAGGLVGFGGADVAQEAMHYATKAMVGEKNASDHSAVVQLVGTAIDIGKSITAKPADAPVHSSFAGRAGAQHLNQELKNLEGQMDKTNWGQFIGNGDNKITVDEIRTTMKKYNICLAEVDKNHDGHITGRELTNALNAHHVQDHRATKPTGQGR